MIKAVIWDLDGVLLDSEKVHSETESETAAKFGIKISPEEVTRLYLGVPIERELTDMAKRAGMDMPLNEALKIRKRILTKKVKSGIPTVPYAKEILIELKSKYRLAFATNTEEFFAQVAMKKAGLFDFFEFGLYARDIQIAKPDPQVFLKVAALLKLDPSEIAVIEDSESGFTAAKGAGMLLIARKGEHNKDKDFSLADYLVEDLREITKYLK